MLKRFWGNPDQRIAAALALLVLLFLSPGFLAGKVLFPSDALYAYLPWSAYGGEMGVSFPHNELTSDQALQNYGWRELAKAALAQGELPLWNPYLFTGMPFLATGQAGVLYPPGLIFLLLPTITAYLWFYALHLFLAGLGMYLFLRVIDTARWAAFLAATVFMFSAPLVTSVQWPQMVSAMTWLPWLLLCLERFLREIERAPATPPVARLLPWIGLGAVMLALDLLAGHLEISFYILVLLSSYALVRLVLLARTHSLRSAVMGGVGGFGVLALGFALAGAQLVPFAEVIQQSVRAGGAGYGDVAQWALPFKQLLALFVPDFFGNPTHHTYLDVIRWETAPFDGSLDVAGEPRSYPFWGTRNYVEAASYVGVLPLVLAGAALLLRRDRYTAFFGAFGFFALAMTLGTPLYALLFLFVPGIEQLHTPFRWLFPFTFCLAVLAGRGADALLSGRAASTESAFARRVGPALVVAAALLLLLLGISRAVLDSSLSAIAALYERTAALRAAFPTVESLYSYELRNLTLFGLLLLLSGTALWTAARSRWRGAPVLLVGVVAVDLAIFGWGYLPFSELRPADFTPPSIQWLQQRRQAEGPFRIATFGASKLLPPNTALLAAVEDIRGYDSVILRQYVEFWRLMEEPNALAYTQINAVVTPEALNSPLLDLMNVRYVVSDRPVNLPGFTLAYQQEVRIYRNEEALPRAFAVYQSEIADSDNQAHEILLRPGFNPRQTVVLQDDPTTMPQRFGEGPIQPGDILEHGFSQLRVHVRMPQPGYLVLTDAYFEGWQATDGQGNALPVLKANGLFRAVALPAGDHTITFRYAPLSFRVGFLLSLLGVAGLLFLTGYWGWQRFRLERTSATTLQRVVKNSVTPLAAQVLGRAVDLGFAIVMLRILGPESYGGYAFAVVLIGYFGIVGDFGLGTLLTREVARDPDRAAEYLGNTLLVRGGLLLATAPVLAATLWLYHERSGVPPDAVMTSGLFFLSLIPSGVAGAFSALFSAHEKMEYSAAMTVVITMLRVLLGVLALVLGWGIIGLGIVSVAASTVNALVFWQLAQRAFPLPRFHIDLSFARGLLGASAPLMINNLLNTIFFRVDVLLLQSFLGLQAVGYYSTAYKFVDGLLMIPSFFTLALFPVFSRFAGTEPNRLLRIYTTGVKGLLIIALPIALALTLLAEPLVTTLFGDAFAPSAQALQVLIWFLPFSYVNGITQYVLIALNQQRYLTGAFAVGTAFNIGANLLVIPSYGMTGAAVTTVLSELVLMAPFLYGIHRYLGLRPLSRMAVRPLAAFVLTAAGLALLQGQSPWLLAALGTALYGALLFLLRVFDAEDRALLSRLFAR